VHKVKKGGKNAWKPNDTEKLAWWLQEGKHPHDNGEISSLIKGGEREWVERSKTAGREKKPEQQSVQKVKKPKIVVKLW
jgi:hypothetical protein